MTVNAAVPAGDTADKVIHVEEPSLVWCDVNFCRFNGLVVF